MSAAFAALIWWVIPGCALIGALGYVLWVSKFQRKFESETSRSVNNFQKFQSSFTAATAVIDSPDGPASAEPRSTSPAADTPPQQ
jgi:hypothetical protein